VLDALINRLDELNVDVARGGKVVEIIKDGDSIKKSFWKTAKPLPRKIIFRALNNSYPGGQVEAGLRLSRKR